MKQILLALILVATVPSVQAAVLSGAQFSDSYQEGPVTLPLRGVGVKHFIFVKVFAAGFYAPDGISANELLGDVPKRLEVAYFESVPARKLAIETRRRIKLNVSPSEYQNIRQRIDVMDGYFMNIRPGDRYVLSYIPGKGTSFVYNDRVIGIIEGADFAHGLFAVWIGLQPIDGRLKSRLLGDQR